MRHSVSCGATQAEEQQQHFQKLGSELVNAIMSVYKQAMACLLPTPAKSHYIFNLRDFSRVVVGICLVRKDKVDNRDVMIRCASSLLYSCYPLISYPRRLCGYRKFESVCLFLCLIIRSITQKYDPKVFKLGIGNDLGIPWKRYCFGVQRFTGQ